MASGAWARSGRRPAEGGGRPAGSFGASLARARAVWDELTGGRPIGGYSDAAAAAIVELAVALWADTARGMASGDGGDGPGDG